MLENGRVDADGLADEEGGRRARRTSDGGQVVALRLLLLASWARRRAIGCRRVAVGCSLVVSDDSEVGHVWCDAGLLIQSLTVTLRHRVETGDRACVKQGSPFLQPESVPNLGHTPTVITAKCPDMPEDRHSNIGMCYV